MEPLLIAGKEDTDNYRTCNKCGDTFPLSSKYFNYVNKSKGTLRGMCVHCRRTRRKNGWKSDYTMSSGSDYMKYLEANIENCIY